MLYDLINNYNVPVKWIINSGKVKDGTDFTYSGIAYRGGPFIIRVEDITPAITARITYWKGQGVQGTYTAASITVPVYTTLTYFPQAMIDITSGKQNIITGYYTNAALPASSYTTGDPSQLTPCNDIWANPHGDPTWSTHSYLYNFVTVYKSFVWSQCHAVSVLEGVANSSSPFQKLNYLATDGLQCYSSNNCGSNTQTHTANPSTPYTYNYATDPVMQFMGTMDGATTSGSEQWYIPQTTGAWRSTTKRLVTTSDGTSPGEGIKMAYGPGYGDATNGYVMYEAGHDLDGSGTTADKVAAQRAFFNFLLLSGTAKQVQLVSSNITPVIGCNETSQVSVSVNSGTAPYTYSWASTVGGTFANASVNTTNYTSPTVASPTTGVLKCVATDACGRKLIVCSIIRVDCNHTLPISLLSFSAKQANASVKLDWVTATEVNNDYFTISKRYNSDEFTEVARIHGRGNTTSNSSYSYLDENPIIGVNYYRLSQTDYDGTTRNIDVKMVRVDRRSETFLIYPNPAHDHFTITFNGQQGMENEQLKIYDVKGKLVKEQAIDNQSSIINCDFSPGVYIVKLEAGERVYEQKLVIE
jgi:hypothetical protein